jgi:glycosyltransferase involved in cell wall biosynthesis
MFFSSMLSSGNSNWRRKTTPSGSGDRRLLKILHVDPEKNWGGGEAQVLGLLSYLAEKGHSNYLLTHPQGRLYQRSEKLKIRALPLVVRNDLDLRSVPAVRRLIRDERFDIVHLHTKRAHALSLWFPRGRVRPKYVVTRRMDYPEARNWYQRCLYNRRVDAVVAISQTIADQLIASGVERKNIRVIYSGIDAGRFSGALERSGSAVPVIGAAAVLEERKGHRYLLQAARLLKEQGHRFKLALAGEGSLKDTLRVMIEMLGLAEEVTLCGFVDDMPSFLAGLDVFVLPSIYEGLGVAALEAMAAGRAVIASRVGGLAETVVDGETGLLVPPGDADSLARAMANLLSDESLRAAFGRRGAERVRAMFTLQRMASKNEQCYYDLMTDGSSSDRQTDTA